MGVAFQLPDGRAREHLGFAWSPLLESALSFPAVARPKRTPMHLPWARYCRDVLSTEVLTAVRELGRWFDGHVPGIFEVGLAGDSATFEDELEAFGRLDERLVLYELSLALGGYGCGPGGARGPHLVDEPTYRSEVVAAAAGTDAAGGEFARAAFDDPGAVRDRLALLLGRYWEEVFHQEWERLLPRIEAEVTDGARALVTRGPGGLVDELLPEGHWDGQATALLLDRTYDATCDVGARGGLLLVPTVYGWPRVLLEMNEPWPLAVIFPLRDLRQPEVPLEADREVAGGLRALGDETRLQITRLVAEQPRSTKELAELLKLSDSAVSRHLRILDDADVVSKQRDGYFVLYRLRPERIGQLGGALRRTLGLAAGASEPVPPLPVSVTRPADR